MPWEWLDIGPKSSQRGPGPSDRQMPSKYNVVAALATRNENMVSSKEDPLTACAGPSVGPLSSKYNSVAAFATRCENMISSKGEPLTAGVGVQKVHIKVKVACAYFATHYESQLYA